MSLPNGTAFLLPPSAAQGLANYPHARFAPPASTTGTTALYVSGTSCRTGDGSYAGYYPASATDGQPRFDITEQTTAVLKNIDTIIRGATNGKCGVESIIDATVFLTDIGKDYKAMNEVWNRFFEDRTKAPARTTVQVSGLPSDKLCIEIKCTAIVPLPQ